MNDYAHVAVAYIVVLQLYIVVWLSVVAKIILVMSSMYLPAYKVPLEKMARLLH